MPARRKPDSAYPTLLCARRACRKPFPQRKPNKRFCSASCQMKDWLAKNPRVHANLTYDTSGRRQLIINLDRNPDFRV